MAQNKNIKKLRVAIVCDWLIGGGAEKVTLELHKIFPKAPVYTSYCSLEWQTRFDGMVVTGYLQYWPFSKLRKLVPILRAWWFKRLDFSDFDLVISSSGAEAKSVRAGAYARHISYIHAPTHYYWDRYSDYIKNPGFGVFNLLARSGLVALVRPMRRWDFEAAGKPDKLIANSDFTAKQIKKYYKRSSTVLHPPIEVSRLSGAEFSMDASKRKGFVIVGRQTYYKRIDLAVGACAKLNLPLTVVGSGPEHKKLRRLAGPKTKFVKNVNDVRIAKIVGCSKAFIFPGLDDFGIAAVEALAVGTPVIAYKDGGALDYIKPGKNGEFFTEQTTESLIKVLKSFKPEKYAPRDIKKSAEPFDVSVFRKKITNIINSL